MASLQNPKSLHCDSPTGTGRKLYTASFPTTGTYLHHHRVYQIIWPKEQRRLELQPGAAAGPFYVVRCMTRLSPASLSHPSHGHQKGVNMRF